MTTAPDDTEARLAAIAARVAAATPGPWRAGGVENPGKYSSLFAEDDYNVIFSTVTREMLIGPFDYLPGGVCEEVDATFIANARSDIPWLLEQLREARRDR